MTISPVSVGEQPFNFLLGGGGGAILLLKKVGGAHGLTH